MDSSRGTLPSSLDVEPPSLPSNIATETTTPRVLRVGQLDSSELDDALSSMLSTRVAGSLDNFGPDYKFRFQPELILLINLIIYRFGMYSTLTTPGLSLQKLQFVPTKWNALSSRLRIVLLAHFLLTPHLLPKYFLTRLKNHALSRSWPDLPRRSFRRRIWNLLGRLEDLMRVGELAGLVWFLYDGRYPSLLLRFLGLRLLPTSPTLARMVSYEFMSRQLVWSTLAQSLPHLLPFLLPMINPIQSIGSNLLQGVERLREPLPDYGSVPRTTEEGRSGGEGEGKAGVVGRGRKGGGGRSLAGPYPHLSKDTCPICHSNSSLSDNTATSRSAVTIPQLPFLPAVPPLPPQPLETNHHLTSASSSSSYLSSSLEPLSSSPPSDPSSLSQQLKSQLSPSSASPVFPSPIEETLVNPSTQTHTPVIADCWAGCEYCYFCLGDALVKEDERRRAALVLLKGEDAALGGDWEGRDEKGWGCLRCGGEVWGFGMAEEGERIGDGGKELEES